MICRESSIYTGEDIVNPVYYDSSTHLSFGKDKDYCDSSPHMPPSMMVAADSVSPKPGLSDGAAVGVFVPGSSPSPV